MSNTRKPRKPQTLDFDKIRAKREAATKTMPPVKIGGHTYRLKPTMPLSVTDYFAERSNVDDETGDVKILLADMQMLLGELFGEEQWKQIRRDIDITDVPDLFNLVFDTYGESVGESSDSGTS